MPSIATKTGDLGQTGLAGGLRLSKSDLRVEAYGTVDELNTFLGFARSICPDPQIKDWTETIQRTLFRVGAALSTPTEALAKTHTVTAADVASLTALVEQIEAEPKILSDWSLPGANTHSAAYEMARTVCRRAERIAVRFVEATQNPPSAPSQSAPSIEVGSQPPSAPRIAVTYLNRLSDLIWLFGRLIELRAGDNATLRDPAQPGPSFSRAW